jgi:hypothetical protein
MRVAVILLMVLGLPLLATAAAHGPVFGLATPTNSQGEWSFDAGVFGRNTSLGSQASVRGLVARLAAVKMKPGNTATLKQLNEAISKNGFTMKDSIATVAGTVVEANGKQSFTVSGSNDVLTLIPDGAAPNAASESGSR